MIENVAGEVARKVVLWFEHPGAILFRRQEELMVGMYALV